MSKKHRYPWNKGLTKKNDKRVSRYSKKISKTLSGKPRYNRRVQISKGDEKKIINLGKKRVSVPKIHEKLNGACSTRVIRRVLKENKVKPLSYEENLGQMFKAGILRGQKKGFKHDKATKKKISKKVKKMMTDPGHRGKISKTMKRKLKSGEIKRDWKKYWKEHPEEYKKWCSKLKGREAHNKGETWSEEWKKKRSIDKKKQIKQRPELMDNLMKKSLEARRPHVLTDSGVIVRSKSEKIISDFLFNSKVKCDYERKLKVPEYIQAVAIKETGFSRAVIYPDFYLPKYGIYIEFFGGFRGRADKNYNKKCESKILIYKLLGLNLISLYPKDLKHLDDFLNKVNEKT